MAGVYCLYTDIQAQSKPILDLATLGWDDDAINLRITEAEQKINEILYVRYDVPFTAGSIPPRVKIICINLALAYCLRDIYMKETPNESETSNSLEEKMVSDLKDLASGKQSLLNSSGDKISTKALGKSFTLENDLKPNFGMGDLGEYDEDEGR